MKQVTLLIIVFVFAFAHSVVADDGYRLWLRYNRLSDEKALKKYSAILSSVYLKDGHLTSAPIWRELQLACTGLLGIQPRRWNEVHETGVVIALLSDPILQGWDNRKSASDLVDEEYLLAYTKFNGKWKLLVTANDPKGLLYGTFHLIRLVQTGMPMENLEFRERPRIQHRILNHWDNLDRTVERGYAGSSIWDWHKLPGYMDPRYLDYARANASIGINGTALTNVNANALVLREDYLKKAAALADVFRPYGIKVFLTARFSAPIELGGLTTADPLDPQVVQWWKSKVDEIYQHIPDFGGFLVKANSEGQPGPQNYNRSHADGANLLATALAPHNGIVIWRAFVYSNENKDDRVKQAYTEFVPLDGAFATNVVVQVKNGPLDFQPREPHHPLFGAMPKTPLAMEFQITQEYLGFATHLFYQAKLYKEVLDADTYVNGSGSPVSSVINGSLHDYPITVMSGVANIGTDRNWCGHPFAQANWYAFGRLAWDHSLTPEKIAGEWISMTMTQDPQSIAIIKNMMMRSRHITAGYMTPLGLHHIMGWSHHYGPAPWIDGMSRADWTSVYYHKADSLAVGFDRTVTGSKALMQYAEGFRKQYEDPDTCPENFLLWFHRVSWDRKMDSGRTLWEEMCEQYYRHADSARWLTAEWSKVRGVDDQVHAHVTQLLAVQQEEAAWWRDACVLYFESRSKRKIPAHLPRPQKTLAYYKKLSFPFAPGIRPQW